MKEKSGWEKEAIGSLKDMGWCKGKLVLVSDFEAQENRHVGKKWPEAKAAESTGSAGSVASRRLGLRTAESSPLHISLCDWSLLKKKSLEIFIPSIQTQTSMHVFFFFFFSWNM